MNKSGSFIIITDDLQEESGFILSYSQLFDRINLLDYQDDSRSHTHPYSRSHAQPHSVTESQYESQSYPNRLNLRLVDVTDLILDIDKIYVAQLERDIVRDCFVYLYRDGKMAYSYLDKLNGDRTVRGFFPFRYSDILTIDKLHVINGELETESILYVTAEDGKIYKQNDLFDNRSLVSSNELSIRWNKRFNLKSARV